MLKRQLLRRYLLALLWRDDVAQSADCELGPLWLNCDGQPAEIFDHETHQLFIDSDGTSGLSPKGAAIIFGFQSVVYSVEPTRLGAVTFNFWIDIVAHDVNGQKRQDILDVIEERILYRLVTHQSFIDASTSETLQSFMGWLTGNQLQITTIDDSDFAGDYTIRRMSVTFASNECIKKQNCSDTPICFDFSDLTRLDEIC